MKDASGLSQRATWIFCVGRECASLFRGRFVEEGVDFIRSVSAPPSLGEPGWLEYLADEINVLCGAGTDNRLVLCGEKEFCARLVDELDPLALESLVGTVDRDLSGVDDRERLFPYVQAFLPSETALRTGKGEAA